MEKLFKVLSYCDIGINYYDPKISVNHLYAAPSKFFEYFGLGLNIISSNNEGINKIILENDIGVCINENEQIGETIDRLLKKGLKSKKQIRDIFSNKYSYEIDAKDTISYLIKLIQ